MSTGAWAGDRQRVRFDVVVDRESLSASNLRWSGSHRLVGQFEDRRSRHAVIRKISLAGELSEPIRHGSHASVSPDGRLHIEFAGDRWVVRDSSGVEIAHLDEAAEHSRHCTPRQPPVWSDDGRFAALIECYGRTTPKISSRPAPTDSVRVIDKADRHLPLEPGARIAVFDRDERGSWQRIRIEQFALQMAWGPESALYVSTSELTTGDASTSILRVKPGSSTAGNVYSTPGRFQNMRPAVHPDGEIIAVVLDADNRVWDDFQSLILIDAETGREVRRLTHGLPLVGADYFWSPTGDEIYVRVRNGGLDQIYSVPVDGQPRRLTHGQRHHFGMQLSPDGRRLSYLTEDGYGRKDIRILDLDTGAESILVVLDEPAGEFKLGLWRHVRWTSTDGVKPFGFLFLPPDFDPTKRYPMLVDVHGGGQGSRLYLSAPFSISVAPGPLEWHAWASSGFVVFVPDYRSTGDYGPDAIRGIYESGTLAATKDIEDIVTGTRYVVQQGFVDPSKIAILGHSAGGQRVLLLLMRSSLYAAAVVNESIAPDPVSLVIGKLSGDNTGRFPDGVFRQLFGADLHECPNRYKANYILDSYRISAPTLIMVGNEALGGVSHMPLEVVYSVLRQSSIPTRMLEFADEGHTYSRADSAKYAFAEARKWVEVHIRSR